MNFNLEMEKRQEKITGILEYYLPKEEGFQKTVLEAMNYSMRAGGKRLRPLLMLETYRMFGGEGQIIEPFMAAMEMIHTHSLIHDDLPALDNDEYRRGRRTTHIVYGEAMAILAGDALLNYAYETAVRAFEIEPGNPAIGKALQILTKKDRDLRDAWRSVRGCGSCRQRDFQRETGFYLPSENKCSDRSVHDGRCGTGRGIGGRNKSDRRFRKRYRAGISDPG